MDGIVYSVKRLFFIAMVGLWAAVIVCALVSPGTLADIWAWVRGSPWFVEIPAWVVFLPWLLGIAVWQSGWPEWVRWLAIVTLAVGWSAASYPRRR